MIRIGLSNSVAGGLVCARRCYRTGLPRGARHGQTGLLACTACAVEVGRQKSHIGHQRPATTEFRPTVSLVPFVGIPVARLYSSTSRWKRCSLATALRLMTPMMRNRTRKTTPIIRTGIQIPPGPVDCAPEAHSMPVTIITIDSDNQHYDVRKPPLCGRTYHQ
jgi:hypothetical protein